MFDVYKPSGKIGAMTYGILLFGIGLTVILAYLYQFLLEWIPWIYVSVLVTVGLGFGLAMIGTTAVNKGRCRNVIFAGLIGIVLATVGVGSKFWFQYQRMTTAVIESMQDDPEIPEEFRADVVEQFKKDFSFLAHIQFRTEDGWEIGRGGGGIPVKGPFVYLIWLIEAGIVYYFAVNAPLQAAREPYSEKMEAWADESQVVMTLPITGSEMVAKIQSASSVEELLEIPIPQTDESNQFAVYTVNSIPGEEMEDAYLTVSSVTYSINNKGEQETETENLVEYAILNKQNREQLVENAELLQEALADYRASLEEADLESEDDPDGSLSELE